MLLTAYFSISKIFNRYLPLLEDAVLEVNRAVEEHFAKMQEETGYVEAYHNLHVYTKEGKDADTYVTFVTYDMKIRGIYTEVPGLATFYAKKEKDKMQVISDPKADLPLPIHIPDKQPVSSTNLSFVPSVLLLW